MRINRSGGYPGLQRGFTLIEMIGVLAIIAILAAAVAPRVFDVIADSRGTRMAAEIRTIETAVSRYYADVGTIKNLTDGGGTVAATTTGASLPYSSLLTSRTIPVETAIGLWKRFRGPYLEKFIADGPAVGVSHSIELAAAATEDVTSSSNSYDLDGDGTNDTPGANNQVVVWLEVTDVAPRDFEKLDSIFDDGVGDIDNTDVTITGRVKYDTSGTLPAMKILIAYR